MASATATVGDGAAAPAHGVKVGVTGFTSCAYFQKAKAALLGLQILDPDFHVEVVEHADRDTFRQWWFAFRDTISAGSHSSSPAVWLQGGQFIGGCDATIDWIKKNYMSGASVSRQPHVSHTNDSDTSGSYQYDLIVIGGGSGGLACSKEAALLGAKTVCLDYVKPSWQGTTWGLGGTCVNVGCIPKKLMHQAALLGEGLKDAKSYGWNVPGGITHDWSTMVGAVQDHIASLNFGYRVALREKGVVFENSLGSFVDPHTIQCVDKKGKTKTITGRRIVIAVGGRPKPLEIPGGELAISSDDLFSLPNAPGKSLVIGASYVALECAGFLVGLGYDVTVLVRSILLRGFDQQCAEAIGAYMVAHGTKLVRPAVPTKIEKQDDGKLRAFWKNADTGEESSDVFDTIFVATGRTADTAKLALDKAGVVVEKDGKLKTVAEQTNVPHIYAIGDVLAGKPELTPVAIMAGKLLAERLFGGDTVAMDYDRIPTTVFTPLEYGNCGLSEEDAILRYGDADIDVFHSSFSPLEWTVCEHRSHSTCYAKLIVRKGDGNRVIGFHILGPNAGEITQGWACAIRLGATYESFRSTLGIHPTMSEEFTTLSITKSSGESADKGGC